MKNLSRFDLGIIIAFVIITILGAGAWYYLSGQLDAAKGDASSAAGDFEKYSKRQTYLPSANNQKVLKSNITLIQSQMDPLIASKLKATGNKLADVKEQSPVDWKHDLDTEVGGLNTAAKLHGVSVPKQFYYSFSRYLNQNPSDEQTVVLTKQLDGVEQIAQALIGAPVKAILTFRRTYDEDATHSATSGMPSSDPDFLPGSSSISPGGVYVAYPFEIEFITSTESFRKVVSALEASPYVFVIRSLTIQNSSPVSPQVGDLDKLAGPPSTGVIDSTPGGVSSQAKARPPQFLFGNETIHVKARIDMIEWKGLAQPETASNRSGRNPRGGER